MTVFRVQPGLLDSADSDVFVAESSSRPQVCERASALSDRARSTSQRLLYRGVRSEWCTGTKLSVGLRWTVAGPVPALGPGVRSLQVPVPNRWCRAPRSGLTLLAAMWMCPWPLAVLRLSPGLKAIQDT
jgi:hypothetical protein